MSIDSFSFRPKLSPVDYPSMGYVTSPFHPKWSTSTPRPEESPECELIKFPHRTHLMKQAISHQGRPVSYPRCSSFFPCCETVLERYPSVFHTQKLSKKPLDFVRSEPSKNDCPTLYYENRPMCTCNCPFPATRSPPCLQNFYKRENQSAGQQTRGPLKEPSPLCYPSFYSWLLPGRRYSPEEIPIDLRLSSMSTHSAAILSHDDERRPAPKRFQCTHCEKSFGKSSHLRDHIRTHTGDRPYRCQYCNKAFTQYSNLRTHTRIHTGEKPYRCRHCNKSFTQAVTLRSHTRTHTGDKPYHCKHCTKSFACFSGLKGHVRVHESGRENVQITPGIKQEDTMDLEDVMSKKNDCGIMNIFPLSRNVIQSTK